MRTVINQPYGHEPHVSVVEPIILALKRRVPIEPFRACNDRPCLAMFVASLAGSNSIFIEILCTH